MEGVQGGVRLVLRKLEYFVYFHQKLYSVSPKLDFNGAIK